MENDAVASIVYMIQDRDFDINVDMYDIPCLLAEWDAEDCMDTLSTFHMRKYYVIKSQSHNPDTPTYMEALSGEIAEEYFKSMYDEIKSIMRRDTWDIVSRKSVADQNVLPGSRIRLFWFKRKPDWKTRKFNA